MRGQYVSVSARKFAITAPAPPPHMGTAERDLVAMGIAISAIIMFVGTGGGVLSRILAHSFGIGVGPDRLLTNALLLNVALVIFGWRRYEDLRREVGTRRAAEAQARLLAETDALTGCLNRYSITEATDTLVKRAAAQGEITAFIMIDLDNFKQINDCNGHGAGDSILQETARRIRAAMPAGALLARLGGDEFACVCAFDPRRPERIDSLATAVLDGVSAPVVAEGFRGQISVSIGITRSDTPVGEASGDFADAGQLLHMADIAMYQAKKEGRNRYVWFAREMEDALRYRSDLEIAIREGLSQGEFVPYYEQQIDLASGELVGFEMLARWHSDQFPNVGPEVFIPVAEDIGVIAEMSEELIRQALNDAKGWDPALTLSVNISPVQLRDPWFAQRILKLLVTANFPPSRLDIEITETCLHSNIAGVHALVTSLKNQGISISLDDFGTGYSSLSHLRSLPFDRIKIDRSFVTSMRESADSATIVRSITSLGEGLGLPITAEGIESEEVLDGLRALGQFKGQGYLYGRPQPADAVRAMLDERAQRKLADDAPTVTDTALPLASNG